MNTVTVVRSKARTTITQDMKIGQVGIASADGFYNSKVNGHTILRTSEGFLDLNTNIVFHNGYSVNVEILPYGSKVTFTTLPEDFEQKLLDLLHNSPSIINAIKYYREVTCEGLKESKAFVEEFKAEALADGRLTLPGLAQPQHHPSRSAADSYKF